MGNQIPESHNQSYENTSESKQIESIVTDLVNAVHIRESIMSETSEPKSKVSATDDLDETSYFEANQSLNGCISTPFDECPNEANYKSNETLVPNTIKDFMELSKDIIDEENDYSSKRSSASSPVSDWKYSTYSSSNSDYPKPRNVSNNGYQSMGSKYNDILDSWNLNKDELKVNPSRTSLMRNFDPLFGTENSPSFPSPPERRKAKQRVDKHFADEYNDSTGLIEDFSKCKITETPKLVVPDFICRTPINNPKPDVLESAVQQQKENELKDRIKELENESKQKDIELEERIQLLVKANEEKKVMTQIVQTLHDINEELFRCSVERLDLIQRELNDVMNAKNETDMKFNEMKVICDKLRNELSSTQMTKKAEENKYLMAVERVKQLEENCNHLMAKNASMEKQIIASDGKKEMENEIITYKVQNKRMEMKIKSLENQLEQKNKENTELSSMVDELIVKVQK